MADASCLERLKQNVPHRLSKAERKILRKQNKALYTVKKKVQEIGEISSCPTPYLLVKNGGLMCGVKRGELINELRRHGLLEDLVMVPGKSYSYALFQEVQGAENAMAKLNGQKILCDSPLANRTLYLVYLVKKPCLQTNILNKTYPTGLLLFEDFVDESEESVLLRYFSKSLNESGERFTKVSEESAEMDLKHRYVKHYGYEFLYGSNTVDIANPLNEGIPRECLSVINKIASLECVENEPDQLTINEYLPGQGIPPHIDTHSAFEDGIISLSLGAKVTMEFRHPDGRHIPVLLPRRSLLVMTKESRYVWTHGITPRKYDVVNEEVITHEESQSLDDTLTGGEQFMKSSPSGVTLLPRETRLSLTFRKVRKTPCDCKFPSYCDSQNRVEGIKDDIDKKESEDGLFVPMTDQEAVHLETKHVNNVYESIAEHFSGTRHSPWPEIANFLKSLPSGSLVADVGCGNGKYLGINEQLFMSGSDRSLNLASICRARGFQVLVCDILNLPYRSNAFDICICIAVIHHLSTSERRLAALKELVRVVRPAGRILVSVWAFEQNLKTSNLKNNMADRHSNIPVVDITGSGCHSDIAVSKSEDDIMRDQAGAEIYVEQEDNRESVDSSTFSKAPRKLKVNTTRNTFEQQDLLVPWHYQGGRTTRKCTNDQFLSTASGSAKAKESHAKELSDSRDLVFQRFYHVFKENELVDSCRTLPNISILRSYYDRGNWCVELEKTGNNE